jgi:UDP-glucuronate 4-epimerase
LIYASSSSVYGDYKKFPTQELQSLNPKNIYSATKLGNELFAEIFSNFYKLESIGLRFFTVYGEWGRPDMFILKYLQTADKNKKFIFYNKGNYYRDFTYIDDVIKLIEPIIFLKKNHFKKHEIFNVCSNKPIKMSAVYNKLKKLHIHNKLINEKKNDLDVFKTHGSNLKISKYSKNLKFTKFDIALRKTYEWFKNNKDLL